MVSSRTIRRTREKKMSVVGGLVGMHRHPHLAENRPAGGARMVVMLPGPASA
jgi:hypothetical protein